MEDNNYTPMEIYDRTMGVIANWNLTPDGEKISLLESIAYSLAVIAEKM